MRNLFSHFWISAVITLAVFVAVGLTLGAQGLFLAATLSIIELTFSFDNAIVNAKVIATLSPFWRRLFLTLGIIIAVVGMRLIFPALLIVVTSGLGFGDTIRLALTDPSGYAEKVRAAEPVISAFGGTFLLTLALEFFALDADRPHWLERIERPVRRFGNRATVIIFVVLILAVLALLPANHHPVQTLLSGGIALLVYYAIHTLTALLPKALSRSDPAGSRGLTGAAAFASFVYLELLDASFSLDGVLGAFAITSNVLLIVAGLGIGAIWVRSLTVYMVKKRTLEGLAYIEHGAHYAILLLALSLLASLFIAIPSWIIGLLDASFSLDGVLGAFAITSNVLLIVAGLGIGAIWVRSLTVYMVKKRTLEGLAYIEHGAHYAILLLAFSLLASLFVSIPSWIIGLLGLAVIGASLVASIRENRAK